MGSCLTVIPTKKIQHSILHFSGFCPDPSLSQEETAFDLTSSFNGMDSDDLNQIDKMFRSTKGVMMLIDTLKSFFGSTAEVMKN